jgi:hypothetical protein
MYEASIADRIMCFVESVRAGVTRGLAVKCVVVGCDVNLKTRGWLALGASVVLAVFMAAIWIWIDRLFAEQGVTDAAAAQFLGRMNVAFALVVISGILGAINGWMMTRSGKRNTPLIVALLGCFVAALVIAWSASSAYHP